MALAKICYLLQVQVNSVHASFCCWAHDEVLPGVFFSCSYFSFQLHLHQTWLSQNKQQAQPVFDGEVMSGLEKKEFVSLVNWE